MLKLSLFLTLSLISQANTAPETVTPDFFLARNGAEIMLINDTPLEGQFLWELGDGNLSTEVDAEHRFSEPGQYRVCLNYAGEGKAGRSCQWVEISDSALQ